MDAAASRLVAALLSQSPGSEVVESVPGCTKLMLALVPVKQLVAVIEVNEPGAQLGERVKQVVDAAKMGTPVHVVLVNPRDVDVSEVIKAHVKPTLLQMKAMGGWTWVPGHDPVSVRGLSLPQVIAAAKLANSSASLSLETMKEESHREADVVRAFQLAVMQRKPVISWAIAVVCVAVFGLQWLWGEGLPVLAASRMGAEIPNRVFAGEWWRLFSVMLLHANLFHLLMNMLAMLSFGTFLERLMGSGRYLLLFVLAGLGGSLLSLTRGGDGIGVGASGGVWGLMVAGAVAVTWPRGLLPTSLATQMRQRAWGPVVINLVYSLQPGIDMLAHVGGGLTGGLLVLALTRGAVPNEPLKPSRLFNVAALGVGLLLAASMGIALMQGRPWGLSSPWQLNRVTLEGTGVTLSVPEGMALKRDKNLWHFGDINETGASLLVFVTEPVAEGEDVSRALEDMVDQLKTPESGFHYAQAPKRTRLPSGREVVFSELAPDDKKDVRFLWEWWSLGEDRRWVRLIANALNTTSAPRRQQLETIADSIVVNP